MKIIITFLCIVFSNMVLFAQNQNKTMTNTTQTSQAKPKIPVNTNTNKGGVTNTNVSSKSAGSTTNGNASASKTTNDNTKGTKSTDKNKEVKVCFWQCPKCNRKFTKETLICPYDSTHTVKHFKKTSVSENARVY